MSRFEVKVKFDTVCEAAAFVKLVENARVLHDVLSRGITIIEHADGEVLDASEHKEWIGEAKEFTEGTAWMFEIWRDKR
jgi:dsDNA-binding SOS-regulon protein